jgi:stage III sporulation protein SpoIIIAA
MKNTTTEPANDLERMLSIMPPHIREAIRQHPDAEDLIEVVIDLGRIPEARFPGKIYEILGESATQDEIDFIIGRVGRFTGDNRAGIERTLHRISAIKNRFGTVIGLTCRVGRAVFGTVDILRDVIESGFSTLLLGRPGVGKTTLLREAARVLADDLGKRVIIVDTSNEIGGDGDIPHPGIGRARRMQVPSIHLQHAVMIEAVENHMPEVIVIDEIGTEAEAFAARTIAERGVQLIATAHGNTVENLLANPTLSDLVGGISSVTLSDEEARRRKTRKTILERKSPPTFDVLVEIQDRDRLVVHYELDAVVDAMLLGTPVEPEIRQRNAQGQIVTSKPEIPVRPSFTHAQPNTATGASKAVRIFTYGVSRKHMERAVTNLRVPVYLVSDMESADIVLTLKSQEKKKPLRLREVQKSGMIVHVIKSNTITQIENFLRNTFPEASPKTPLHRLQDEKDNLRELEAAAEKEAEQAVIEVYKTGVSIELSPQNAHHRRLQHEFINQQGLVTQSRGRTPRRRVVVYPA